ncbi:MAG: RHS repeat-associated core domain-containing protein, partial [Candidatus Omnitrophota bacterium]|nr:RHS repeat-associated core domain-containing protein [Candidatus Omnitrophota bacterium]
ISWLTAGLDADQVLVYDAVTQTLKPPTETTVGQAYFVHVVTTSLFTPSLPRDPTTRFVYDGDGGKVKQITASGTTTLLGEVFEKAPSGTTTKYVFAGAERICAVVRGPSTVDYRYYHGDHLGSTNLVTDGTGQVVELAEYTPYGSLAAHSGSADVAHKFTGQRQDVTHGLILFPGRVYDPALGRFLQADPFVQDPADPQMLNRYSYVRNNPLAFTDPSGYKKKRSFFRVLFAVIAAVVVTVATGGHAELGAQIFSAIVVATAAAVGDQVGAAVDRASSNSSPSPSTAEAASPRGPPSPSPAAAPAPLGHAASFIGPVRYTDADDGSISDRKLLAKRYRQDLKLIRALSLKASDRFRATVGARPIEGIGAGHRYIAAPNGNRFEMGPLLRQGRPIVTSNTTDVSTWDTSLTTQSAIAAGLATTATANVSASGFVTSMGLYEAYFGGQQYNALSYNSNFAVNSVIYGAGGPEVKNLGYTPGFPDN